MGSQARQAVAAGAGIAAFALALAAAIAGCGGGSSTASTDTGSSEGSLATVQISPPPGTTFISRSTKFYLSWDAQTPPPPSFTATLVRYSESCSDSSSGDQFCSKAQKTVLTRIGSGYTWEVKRKDDYALDQGGVYYLQLDAGPEEILATYLVTSDGRAAQKAALSTTPTVENAGPDGALRHLVVTR